MADTVATRRARLAVYLRTRGVRFWSVSITVVAVAALFIGSQIARNLGQSVDWYTGFGQWLGALGSFVAAGAALWISLSDRRHQIAERQRAEAVQLADRQREQDQQNADLERQAGLVRVTVKEFAKRQAAGPNHASPGIGIQNRREDRIFDLDVVRLVHRGQEIELEIGFVNGLATFPRRPEHENRFPIHMQLDGMELASDELLVLYHSGAMPGSPAEYAAVRYTDTAGRRWEVDTSGAVTRL